MSTCISTAVPADRLRGLRGAWAPFLHEGHAAQRLPLGEIVLIARRELGEDVCSTAQAFPCSRQRRLGQVEERVVCRLAVEEEAMAGPFREIRHAVGRPPVDLQVCAWLVDEHGVKLQPVRSIGTHEDVVV